jgi:hypothetical protein
MDAMDSMMLRSLNDNSVINNSAAPQLPTRVYGGRPRTVFFRPSSIESGEL